MNENNSITDLLTDSLTLYDKIWRDHLVHSDSGTSILYIDRHLVHEVTSPQAFEGLRLSNRSVRRPELTLAVMDHNVSTRNRDISAVGAISQKQMETLAHNCQQFGVRLFDLHHPDQGIVHIIGPELAFTLPGTVVVCGDSHTSTHGAFGALAFGIGTSEVEHVLATQTLQQKKSKNMLIRIKGRTEYGVSAKDIILAVIDRIGVNGGAGYVIEFTGEAISDLSMEGRMTVCNMSIEAGARAGLIAPDQKTFDYIKGKDLAPRNEDFTAAVDYWKSLVSDKNAVYDACIELEAQEIAPRITWGTNPGQSLAVNDTVPDPGTFSDPTEADSIRSALIYMDLEAGQSLLGLKVDRVFIGSCTNGRLEDIRAAARTIGSEKVAAGVQAMVVPGSGRVKRAAEKEGLDRKFIEAGFEWREAGCSMCLAMNDDILEPGQRCASTSNRNFEGRQGKNGRTHLVGPEMAAAAAIAGHFVDLRKGEK